MKVGTDGVLLGAWCRIEPSQDKAILDIGTGTGVIALQLAQRTESIGTGKPDTGIAPVVDAVELDEPSFRQAQENFDRSPWRERLRLYRSSIQDFTEAVAPATQPETQSERRYDHIVSNPPWFVGSLTSPDASRTTARHSDSLSYDDLMKCCFRLLKPDGRISLVLPAGAETEKMIVAAAGLGFAVSRRTDVHSTPKSGPKRTLLEFSRRQYAPPAPDPDLPPGPNPNPEPEPEPNPEPNPNPAPAPVLIIEDNGPGTFSAEYRALTRDFYLYF